MRRFLALLLLCLGALPALAAGITYPTVKPGVPLRFPADHGAHPDFRTEWWYATGWLKTEDGRDLGFQVTFFRTRPDIDPANPSRFAPSQILFAHAGLSDPQVGRLLHGEKAARAGFGIAEAATEDAAVTIEDWFFRREADNRFATRVSAPDFTLDLGFAPTQEPFLQGVGGYSQKGPDAADASHYYSMPHLRVSGTVTRNGKATSVSGEAWLDREWSSNYLVPDAQGWDWTGLNLDDGGALMAFRIRGKNDETIWAGGSLRRPDGTITQLSPQDVRFTATRRWRSPDTQAEYPVAQVLSVSLPEGVREFPLEPLFDAQELDGRGSGLPVYWEGAVKTTGGRGYLELTGYASPLSL